MDRRPIASRGSKWAQIIAKFLAQKNITPNTISLLSVFFSLLSLCFFSLAISHKWFLFLAAICIQLRLLCNLFDGMVAVEYNKKSIYGNLFNDIPDRFADVFIIMGAGIYSFYNEKTFSSGLDLAWMNSILAVITAYVRVLGASIGTPIFFSGIMAKPQRMAILTIVSILSLISQFTLPFFYFALVIMFIGQCLTIIKRIQLIANDLKQKANK
jgi:phosphatidylglycerophosphate synthase